jgi:hypothetical protein
MSSNLEEIRDAQDGRFLRLVLTGVAFIKGESEAYGGRAFQSD